jgi:hypothetical protein
MRRVDASTDGAEKWEPCFDLDTVVNTFGGCLVFVDVDTGNTSDELVDDPGLLTPAHWTALGKAAEVMFAQRYPSPTQEAKLTTFGINTSYEYLCAEDADWETRRRHGAQVLKSVNVYATPSYQGYDVGEVIAEVRKSGKLRVARHEEFRFGGCSRRRYGGSDAAEELLEEEMRCIQDEATGDWYVVKDPEWAKKLQKRRATAQKRQKDRGGRTTKYLQVYEFAQVISALAGPVREHVGCAGWRDFDMPSRPDRGNAIYLLQYVLEHINLVFGRNAHRQIPEWWEFMKLWKKHGEDTKRVWGNTYTYRGCGGMKLFEWLDEEAKARKPPKACLTSRTDKRLIGLPGHLDEEGYMRKYQPAKWEKLYGEKEKEAEEAEGEAEDPAATSAA